MAEKGELGGAQWSPSTEEGELRVYRAEPEKWPSLWPRDALTHPFEEAAKVMGTYVNKNCPKPKNELCERSGDPAHGPGEQRAPPSACSRQTGRETSHSIEH